MYHSAGRTPSGDFGSPLRTCSGFHPFFPAIFFFSESFAVSSSHNVVYDRPLIPKLFEAFAPAYFRPLFSGQLMMLHALFGFIALPPSASLTLGLCALSSWKAGARASLWGPAIFARFAFFYMPFTADLNPSSPVEVLFSTFKRKGFLPICSRIESTHSPPHCIDWTLIFLPISPSAARCHSPNLMFLPLDFFLMILLMTVPPPFSPCYKL